MNTVKLMGLGMLVVLVSALLGEYTGRILGTIFAAWVDYMGGMGDGPLIFYSLLLVFVIRPLIAGGFGALLWRLVWHATNRANQRSQSLGTVALVSVSLGAVIVSIVWVGLEIFWLESAWP